MDKPTHIKGPWNPKNFLNSVGDNQDILRMFELENKEELEEVLHSLSKEIDYIPRSESVFKRTKNKQRVEYAMTISVSEKRRKNIIGILRQLGIF